MKFSTLLVKQSLDGHSWLGLTVGLLMYIVCLTGTLCVFYPELQRWEQADISESTAYDLSVLEDTFNDFLADDEIVTGHMYLNLPTEDHPRISVATEEEEWFVNADGSLGERVNHGWTEFLVDLHVYLTIPSSLGIILVSALGAMLCGLIISGFLSHPRILKDAFKLRMDGSSRMEQVDIHNRLSVWGAPFHLLIAVTGAYFGLVLPALGVISLLTGDDPAQIEASVFGVEPELHQEGSFEVVRAFENLETIAPDVSPFLVVVHDAGEPGQFLEILANHPQRMIYSENYQFDTEGNYLSKTGFSDGEAGKQIVYSMYDLHFGHFAGYLSKAIYAVLGLALTVVSVTGINIWLRKRNYENSINELWVGCVWGLPLALLLAALAQLVAGMATAPLFWSSYGVILIYCFVLADPVRCRRDLLLGSALLTLVALVVQIGEYGSAALTGGSLLINIGLLGLLVSCLLLTRNSWGGVGKEDSLAVDASTTA